MTEILQVTEGRTRSDWKDHVKTKTTELLKKMLKQNEIDENYVVCGIILNELERREIAEKF